MGSDTNPYGYRCDVATREKTAILSLRIIVLFTLHALLMRLSVACNLILDGVADAILKVDY